MTKRDYSIKEYIFYFFCRNIKEWNSSPKRNLIYYLYFNIKFQEGDCIFSPELIAKRSREGFDIQFTKEGILKMKIVAASFSVEQIQEKMREAFSGLYE